MAKALFASACGAFCHPEVMSTDRNLLDGDRATAFDEAFDKRRDYIHAEGIDLLIDGEDCVPLPGCPQCGSPAENYVWSTYNEGPGGVLFIDVDPCGHRFRTSPVPARFDPDRFWWPPA